MPVAAPLESLVAQQAATIDKLSAERAQYRKLYLDLLERCAMLERGIIVGKKAEPFRGEDPQLTLQMLEMLLGEEDESQAPGSPGDDSEKVREHERRKPGRKLLPEHLPRVEIEVLPIEVQRKASTRSRGSARKSARCSSAGPPRWSRSGSCGQSSSSARRRRTSIRQIGRAHV